MQKTVIFNALVYLQDRTLSDTAIVIENGKIAKIVSSNELSAEDKRDANIINANGQHVVPGFVDVHVHGGGGHDVMTGTPAAIDGMSRFHARYGTTSLLPTTWTESFEAIMQAVLGIRAAMEQGTQGAEILGVHLEGPFLNPTRCGAQHPGHMRNGSISEFEKFNEASGNAVRLMTIAPEVEGSLEVIQHASSRGITMSVGHSDADYTTVSEAVKFGARHATHLFNGMRPMHHREPGTAGAALMLDDIAVELITDGIHVAKEWIQYVYKTKPNAKIVAITDCVTPAGMPDGEYTLGGQQAILKDGQIRLASNPASLAGSTLTMDVALRNTLAFTGRSLLEVLPAFTMNPARQIGVSDRKGSILVGKDADLVILSGDMRVVRTIVNGKTVFETEA